MAKSVGKIVGGVLGAVSNKKTGEAITQAGDSSKANLGRASKLVGTDPKVQAQIMAQYQDMIRAAQADRGVYSSGPSIQQESFLMPQMEQGFRDKQFQQLLQLAGGYKNPAQMYGMGGDFQNLASQGWANFGTGAAEMGSEAIKAGMTGGMSTALSSFFK